MSRARVRELLARHQLLARRDLGQNFLVDADLAQKLADFASVQPCETVLEIGAGLGVLTRALAQRAARVVTLEIDSGLVRVLQSEGDLPANVELHHVDALKADLGSYLPRGPARIVANLPYRISAPLMRRFLDLRERLSGWSVMVQRELADRLVAASGSRDYGSLSVLHQLTVTVEGGLDVHPRCFFPVPQVTSRFVNVRPLPEALVPLGELPGVERVVRAAFRHRRKTLVNSLRAAASQDLLPTLEVSQGVLAELGIDGRARAEELTPAQLLGFARRLLGGAGATHG